MKSYVHCGLKELVEYEGNMNTIAITSAVMEINSGLYGIWTHDLCDTGAMLYQLSKLPNWELVIMFNSLIENQPSYRENLRPTVCVLPWLG